MAKKSTTPWNCQCEVGQRNRTLAEIAGAGEEVMKPALLLHSCCGPCSTSVIERLAPDYEITVFFIILALLIQRSTKKEKLTR